MTALDHRRARENQLDEEESRRKKQFEFRIATIKKDIEYSLEQRAHCNRVKAELVIFF